MEAESILAAALIGRRGTPGRDWAAQLNMLQESLCMAAGLGHSTVVILGWLFSKLFLAFLGASVGAAKSQDIAGPRLDDRGAGVQQGSERKRSCNPYRDCDAGDE